jgi:hypothetical protein
LWFTSEDDSHGITFSKDNTASNIVDGQRLSWFTQNNNPPTLAGLEFPFSIPFIPPVGNTGTGIDDGTNDVVFALQSSVQAVPEPSTLALAALGLLTLAFFCGRRRKKQAAS